MQGGGSWGHRAGGDVGTCPVSAGSCRGAAESGKLIGFPSASPHLWLLSFTFFQSSSPYGTVLCVSPLDFQLPKSTDWVCRIPLCFKQCPAYRKN